MRQASSEQYTSSHIIYYIKYCEYRPATHHMAAIVNAFKGCCPCLWDTLVGNRYRKVVQKIKGETEHQQFMKETIQPNHDQLQYKQQSPAIKQLSVTPSPTMSEQPIASKNISYSDCLSLEHPYYNLLKPKLDLLPNLFEIQAEPESKVAENQYNLKIYIKQSEDDRTNVIVYTFEFPTSYEFYEEMQNNFELQRNFDSNIDSYECQDQIDENSKLIYLAYKKILIVSPRDFVFIRYTFKKGTENWSIATSLPDAPTIPGKQRGVVLFTATRAVQKDNKLYLSVYSHIDMRMPVKASATKARGMTEIKKYLDKCYNYVKSQNHSMI